MSNGGVSRRDFLKIGAAAAAVGAVAPRIFAADAKPADAAATAPKLDYRVLGRTGLKVTTVSLGCMVAPEPVIEKAFDLGINWFDTANSYKGGKNEEEVGRVLAGAKRQKAYICTKVRATVNKQPATAAQLMEALEGGLKRLQTDHVDLVLTHGTSSREQIMSEATLEFFRKAKESGKARFVGTSTHTNMTDVVKAATESGAYDAVLTTYNYNVGKDLREAVAAAKAKGVGIIAMKSQAPVVELMKKHDGEKKTNPNAPAPKLPFAHEGLAMHEAALKWVLDDANVTCAVPGTRDFDQLTMNVGLMGKRLGYLDRRRLERYGEATAAAYCSGCGRCAGTCRAGVSIPDIRRSMMYLSGYGERKIASDTYRAAAVGAAACAACGECTARCVNGVALQPILAEAHRRLA